MSRAIWQQQKNAREAAKAAMEREEDAVMAELERRKMVWRRRPTEPMNVALGIGLHKELPGGPMVSLRKAKFLFDLVSEVLELRAKLAELKAKTGSVG